jgi:hypothetical protein
MAPLNGIEGEPLNSGRVSGRAKPTPAFGRWVRFSSSHEGFGEVLTVPRQSSRESDSSRRSVKAEGSSGRGSECAQVRAEPAEGAWIADGADSDRGCMGADGCRLCPVPTTTSEFGDGNSRSPEFCGPFKINEPG